MRRSNKKTIPISYILSGLSFLCAVLIILSFIVPNFASPVKDAVSYVVIPVSKGMNEVGEWFSDRKDDLSELRDVMAENEELQAKIHELTIENNTLQQDKYELNRLRELYKLDAKYPGYEKVGARIVGKDAGNWFHTFVIDKGSNDGIKVDMNVIAGSGLVGRVTAVSPNSASVLSIIDDSSNVAAQVLSTSDNCIVTGSLKLMNQNKISISKLSDADNKVIAGEKIVTSNISDKYLPGILIGYVDEISMDSNNLTKSGTIRPAVDFNNLEEVLVILELKNKE